MAQFAANLSMMFHELPFLDRFAAAKRAGFEFVECWFPYDYGIPQLQRILSDNELKLIGINSAPGRSGEWGLAALPGRRTEFDDTIKQALEYAEAFGSMVHVMAGLCGAISRTEAEATYLTNLESAIEKASPVQVQLLIEPLNSRDRPTYFLNTADQAAKIIERRGFEQLKMMFDCYHIEIESGDLVNTLRRHLPSIGHIQFAGIPDRGEPDRGDFDFDELFQELDRVGWSAPIGAEYKPAGLTADGLSWLGRWS